MKTALFIGAHPDDIEIGCGGAVQYYLEKNYHVEFLVCTSGEEGGQNIDKFELKKVREVEALRSAKSLGVSQVHFLNFPDGLTLITKEMKIEFIKKMKEISPAIVFTHSSQDHFPDHKIISDLSLASIIAASGPWYPEVKGGSLNIERIFGYEVWNPCNQFQVTLDISKYIYQKVNALKEHKSQLKDINYENAVLGLGRFRGAMTSKGEFCEVFEVLKDSI